MTRETMTGRQRWLAVLRREKPDRIPMDFWATAEAAENLRVHMGCATLDEALAMLHVDRPLHVSPRYVGPALDVGCDIFGVRHADIVYSTGTYSEAVTHPLADFTSVEEIERGYTWPSVDWFDFSQIRQEVENHPDRVILGGATEPFLVYCHLRGIEQAFTDLACEPEIAHYCLGRMFDLAHETVTRIYESAGPGNVQISYVSEDMGSQIGLMFSPEQVREFLIPGMKRMIDLAHQAGVYVFHHNDGAIRDIIPTMIEAGIDVLNPVQWRCVGMDRDGLKRDFGDRLMFHGGVDNQHTLPFGTPEEVRQEVVDNIEILGSGGGYILAPCHNIQPVTPPENIIALYESGYEYGWC